MTTITIDPRRYNEPIELKFRGVKITLHIPPNFIPESVQGQYVEKNDIFEIHFNYKDTEAGMVEFENNQFVFIVGKNTKKLISISIKSIKASQINGIILEQKIKSELPQAFEQIKKHFNRQVELRNFDVSRNVIMDGADNLIKLPA